MPVFRSVLVSAGMTGVLPGCFFHRDHLRMEWRVFSTRRPSRKHFFGKNRTAARPRRGERFLLVSDREPNFRLRREGAKAAGSFLGESIGKTAVAAVPRDRPGYSSNLTITTMSIDLQELLRLRLGLSLGRPCSQGEAAGLMGTTVAAVEQAEHAALAQVGRKKKPGAVDADGTAAPAGEKGARRMMTIFTDLQRQFDRPNDRSCRVNTTTLCRKFSVDEKTIRLDIERMKYPPYSLPIEYSPSLKSFQYTRRVTEFMGGEYTPDELVALVLARQAMEAFKGAPFAGLLKEVFSRVTMRLVGEAALLGQSDLSQLISVQASGAGVVADRVFKAIITGLLNRKVVSISYRSKQSDAPKQRKIEPHHLALINNQWVVIAYDSRRSAFLPFVLSRIDAGDIRFGEKEFERRADFKPSDYVGSSFGVQTGREIKTVRLRIGKPGRHFVKERLWHPSQKVSENADGSVEVSFLLSDFGDLERWILSFGSDCVVLEPAELRERVREEARKMLGA